MPLQKLSDELIAKIAAGEVIERPASVVKELVENSIDAGARSIQVEVEDGGRKGITVIDDGVGMTPEEAPLSLESHATSKISSDADLFRIRTLGFRGEALPSIAAVSYLTLESRGADTTEAVRIEVEGGRVIKNVPSSLHVGTRIAVRNLFFNTPARLKFLKSKETEFSHISQWVETMALAHPEIGFTLTHQGKRELQAIKRDHPQDRIRDILGAEVAQFMLPFQAGRAGMELLGYCSEHQVTSFSAKSISLFVNGRAVRDRLLQHAVIAAYENLLMKGRTPWVVLYLKVPPEFVDVNVHPTKNEVRFAQGQVVHELVREAVRGALRRKGATGVAENSEDLSDAAVLRPILQDCGAPPYSGPQSCLDGRGRGVSQEFGASSVAPSLLFHDLHILGQVHNTYLICETPDQLILIDQHAAHERIGFEKLKRQHEAGGIARQQLLIPQNFDLRPSQGEILKKYLDELARVGLEVEFFGGNTFILRSLPALLVGTDVVALIIELVESLQAFEKLGPLEERIHEVLETMACHAQVRSGDRLGAEEIASLIAEMRTTNFSYSCPHGRPAVLQIPFGEIEKWFKRKL